MKSENMPDAVTPSDLLPGISQDDAFTKFLVKNWKNITIFFVVCVVGIYFYRSFESTRLASLRSAADLFSNVRSQYAAVLNAKSEYDNLAVEKIATDDPTKAASEPSALRAAAKLRFESEQTKLTELLTALSDKKEPYKTIAVLYQSLLAATNSDLDKLKSLSQNLNWKSFIKAESPERFFAELQALIYAKALIDTDYPQASKILSELANDAFFVNVSAATTISKIAQSAEEKAQAKTLLETVKKNNPEQNELLEEEFNHLADI